MKIRTRQLDRITLALIAVLVAGNVALIGAYAAGFRLNLTASMPEGIYRIVPVRPGLVGRGTVVVVCPSPAVIAAAAPRHYLGAGACPGGVEPLLKHVAALGGDAVSVSDTQVAVNGHALPASGRLERDCAGRPLARIAAGRYRIAPEAMWLYAPVPRSWDSRYFGPQPVAGIIGTATPILIIGNGTACAS